MNVSLNTVEAIAGCLIASCQADRGNPMNEPQVVAAVAMATLEGGAGGLRLNGADHIAAVRQRTGAPIIGIGKQIIDGAQWITPWAAQVEPLIEAGATVIAADATSRNRPGDSFEVIASEAHRLGALVMADTDTLEAGIEARSVGADLVATTLSGYTPETAGSALAQSGPDVNLVAELAAALDCPVVAEGRYRNPSDIQSAFESGAHSVVVGTAISDPTRLTQPLVAATPRAALPKVDGGA